MISVDLGDFFSRFDLSFLTTPQSRPLCMNSMGRPKFTTIYNPENGYFGGNYSVLYYVACPSVYCSLAVLSRLLVTIARISNDKLV